MTATVYPPPPGPPGPFGHAAPPPGPVTWEEFLAWLDEDVRAEWVDGVIEVMLPVSYEHQSLGTWMIRMLGEYVEARALGEIIQPLPMLLPHPYQWRHNRSARLLNAKCVSACAYQSRQSPPLY